VEILLLDIFPRGRNPNPQRGKILQVNQIVRKLAHRDEKVHYLAIGHHFVEDDGTISKAIMPDSLHLSPAGYQFWADAIEGKLRELLGEA
jgi:lysophospholipase L1-like esterase